MEPVNAKTEMCDFYEICKYPGSSCIKESSRECELFEVYKKKQNKKEKEG